MIFYYVRHGEPIYDPNSLTEYGKEQAKALAQRFILYGLDEIYSSPSNRALQTAQETCKALHKKPILLEWTSESLAWKDFSVERNGKSSWVFQNPEYIELFANRSMFSGACGDNSCFKQTNIRKGLQRIGVEADLFLLKLGFRHIRESGGYEVVNPNSKRIALFAHQGFGMAFLSSLLDIPYPIFCTKFDMGHSGVTVIYFDEKNKITYPKVLQLSNDSHLYKEGLLKGYQGWIDI